MIILLMGISDAAYGQSMGAMCVAPAPPSLQEQEAGRTGSFSLVPSMCLSERYDSNVFFSPSIPGVKREDYVTTVNPLLKMVHNGEHATGFLDVGGVSETYVNNTGLNFLGSNGTLFLNLDNTVKKILPNARLLITDAVTYAPSPPGFVNPVAGTNPGAPVNIGDVFAQGILFSRTNRVTNNGSVSVAYDTSRTTSVTASYSHGLIRFLSSPIGLFDTVSQTASVGVTAQPSSVDQVRVGYSYSHSEFEDVTSSAFLFKAHTVIGRWSRVLTQHLNAEVGGGGIVIDPGLTTYAANAALVMNFVTSRATLSYSRSAFPSFTGVATQVVGDVVSLSAVHQISPAWQLSASGNFSHSSGSSGTSSIKFDSYGGSVNVAYFVTRIWSTAVGYNYARFDQETGGASTLFDRHVAMFSVRATWE